MQIELNLPISKEKKKGQETLFLYNILISKGKVPTISANDLFIPIKDKRKFKAKTFDF